MVLPPEFVLAGLTSMEPWTGADSLALLKLYSFKLSSGWTLDLARHSLSQIVRDRTIIDELLPRETKQFTAILNKAVIED